MKREENATKKINLSECFEIPLRKQKWYRFVGQESNKVKLLSV